jgi:hypothetical protein
LELFLQNKLFLCDPPVVSCREACVFPRILGVLTPAPKQNIPIPLQGWFLQLLLATLLLLLSLVKSARRACLTLRSYCHLSWNLPFLFGSVLFSLKLEAYSSHWGVFLVSR